MLYHVRDRRRAISELHRVLNPGELLLTATNGAYHLIELAKLVQRFDPSYMNVRGAESFGLENGAAQLSEFFSEVEYLPFDSNILVTEVERLLHILYCEKGNDSIYGHFDSPWLNRSVRITWVSLP